MNITEITGEHHCAATVLTTQFLQCRKNYDVLSDLSYNSMEHLIYAKRVITCQERMCIKTFVGSEKMEFLFDVRSNTESKTQSLSQV